MKPTEKTPAHFVVYEQLREMVLFGELKPGDAVTIQGLIDRLNAGMTPVREALRRLIAEGALEQSDNRRVCVPVLTSDCAEEINLMRKMMESELVRRAFHRITETDLSRLEQIDARLDSAIMNGDVSTYLIKNYQFHKELYRIADAPIIAETVDRLWLRFGPALRIVCGRSGTQNLPDKHAELLIAIREQNVEGAVKAITEDIEQGIDQIKKQAE